MNITCETARDLIPLYLEGIASPDSAALVEAHMVSCEHCKQELENMRASHTVPADTDIFPLKRIRADLRNRKRLTIAATVMLSLAVVVIVMGYLTSPIYIPYSKDKITVTEKTDGTVLVEDKTRTATGYDVEKTNAGDTGAVYHIAAWYSLWDKYVMPKRVGEIVLNASGETLASVYYYNTDGHADVLIYGTDQNPGGGVMSLPRLVLSYYALMAVALLMICGIGLLIFYRNKKARRIIIRISLFPVSYLLSHICVKGFTAATYSPAHDFFTIILAAVALYGALLLGVYLFSIKKRRL